jgi:hypothetical protein
VLSSCFWDPRTSSLLYVLIWGGVGWGVGGVMTQDLPEASCEEGGMGQEGACLATSAPSSC